MRHVLVAAFWLVAGVTMAQTNVSSRYQVIVERLPFGQVTPAGAAATQPGFATRFQFVGLVYSNGIPLAIVNDTQGKQAYFRFAGETIDDVKVVKIETKWPPKVVLQQGLVQASLGFEERKETPGGLQMPVAEGRHPSPPMFAPGTPPGSAVPRRIPFQRGKQ